MAASLGSSAIEKEIDYDAIATDGIAMEGSRIVTLEHALDQALLVIADLRAKLRVQTVLEEQLAETESCSHIQQTAILSLKQQLRDAQDRVDQSQRVTVSQAETIATVREELDLMVLKKEALERQVDHLSRREAQLQHQGLEMHERCKQQELRIETLETQMTELQEQVLHQAQLLREQEMATQHWKGRCQSLSGQCQAFVQHFVQQLECNDRGEGLAELGKLKTFLETVLKDDGGAWDTPVMPEVNLPPFLQPKLSPSKLSPSKLAPSKLSQPKLSQPKPSAFNHTSIGSDG